MGSKLAVECPTGLVWARGGRGKAQAKLNRAIVDTKWPKMSQNGHFPPARVRGYPRLGVLWIRIRRIPGWYPPTHRQGTPGGKYPPQYSTTRGHVGWCWCVFRRFYVSERGVYRRGLWTKGGLWTTTGYLSGSMGRILCSHEPTGPVCGCLTLFMFMKVSVNGRPLQF